MKCLEQEVHQINRVNMSAKSSGQNAKAIKQDGERDARGLFHTLSAHALLVDNMKHTKNIPRTDPTQAQESSSCYLGDIQQWHRVCSY